MRPSFAKAATSAKATADKSQGKLRAVALASVLLLSVGVFAQDDPRWIALEQQINRIYGTNEYSLPRFGPARWLGEGTAYTIVERNTGAAGGADIVRYDAATGARSILIS